MSPFYRKVVTPLNVSLSLLMAGTAQAIEAPLQSVGTQFGNEAVGTPLKRGKRAVTSPTINRWPNRTIPYVLTNASPKVRSLFLDAARHIAENSAIRFVERTNESDYLYVFDGPSDAQAEYPPGYYGEPMCHSFIGKAGGPQEITLTPSCQSMDTVLHELMHAVGFGHEHQRPDRDQYVTVTREVEDSPFKDTCDPVSSSLAQNLGNDSEASLNIGPYDLDSVMHYEAEQGIGLRNPASPMRAFPRNTLSTGDIAGLEVLYGGAPKNTGPAPTDNKLHVVMSKYELVLAENTTGEVELKVLSDVLLTDAPRVESENPLITANAVRKADNTYTIQVQALSGANTAYNATTEKRPNRIFFHFRTSDGKAGVAIFRVSVVKPACVARSFRQLVSLWQPAGSEQKFCLQAKRLTSNIQQNDPVAIDEAHKVSAWDEAMSVGLAPCDASQPLQLWRQEANGRLTSAATSHCLSLKDLFTGKDVGRASVHTSQQCGTDIPPAVAEWRYEAGKLINTAYPRSALSATNNNGVGLFPTESRPVTWQQWVWY
ncbi:M12 family metallopeptidase [Chitinimonas sp. PSY-7]|uniref:M12 family metallopeptidase n=1 Tax=Chitinimonas sp. PSY-7 TaxID=3459088 RepID=UPI00403FEC8C